MTRIKLTLALLLSLVILTAVVPAAASAANAPNSLRSNLPDAAQVAPSAVRYGAVPGFIKVKAVGASARIKAFAPNPRCFFCKGDRL